jgi:hypothetical protein
MLTYTSHTRTVFSRCSFSRRFHRSKNQSNWYCTARVMSFGKRTVSAKSVTNKYFSISIKCNDLSATVFAGCFRWSTVVQSSYSQRCCLLACKRAWHKCDKSIQYRVIFRVLPCTTGSGVDGDVFFHFFVRSLEVRMARETCPLHRCIRLARSNQ